MNTFILLGILLIIILVGGFIGIQISISKRKEREAEDKILSALSKSPNPEDILIQNELKKRALEENEKRALQDAERAAYCAKITTDQEAANAAQQTSLAAERAAREASEKTAEQTRILAIQQAAEQAARDAAAVRDATQFDTLAAQQAAERAAQQAAFEVQQAPFKILEENPIEFIRIRRTGNSVGINSVYSIDIAEIQLFDLNNNLINIISHGYGNTQNANYQEHIYRPSINAVDRNVNTYASIGSTYGEPSINNYIFVRIQPTLISNISNIIIIPGKSNNITISLRRTSIEFIGTYNGQQNQVLNKIDINTTSDSYNYQFKNVNGVRSWESSGITVQQQAVQQAAQQAAAQAAAQASAQAATQAATQAAAQAAAQEQERLRLQEEFKLLLQSTPINYLKIGRTSAGGPNNTITIDVAEIQVYDLSNNLIPIIDNYYVPTNDKGLEGKYPSMFRSVNVADGDFNTFARAYWSNSAASSDNIDNGIQVVIQPTRISNISKIVITPMPGQSLIGTYISFIGVPEGRSMQELLNRINITEDKINYTFRFSGSGTNTSWLSSRINLPQYLRHLQNKNYLLY